MPLYGGIMLVGLKTAARWADLLIIEVYQDAGLSTLVGRKTSKLVWDVATAHNTQLDPAIFGGLTFGQTYYVRVGTVTKFTGLINWSATFSVVAGNATSPGSAQFSTTIYPTSSGVTFSLSVTNPPSDYVGMEVVWYPNSTVPGSSTSPLFAVDTETSASIFAGGSSGVTITAWARVVTTSAKGGWVSLGSGVVGSGGDAGTFLALNDTPASFVGKGGNYVAVKSDASALEFVVPSTKLRTRSIWSGLIALGGGGGNYAGYGLTTTNTGTISSSAPDSSQPQTRNHATGTTSGNEAYVVHSIKSFAFGREVVTEVGFRLMQSTGVRAWLGMTDSDFSNEPIAGDEGASGNDHLGFRYSTSAGDTSWKAVARDGSTQTVADTEVSIDAAFHVFHIIHYPGVKAEFYIDGVLKATITTNLPSTSTQGKPFVGIKTLEGVAKNFRLSHINVSETGY